MTERLNDPHPETYPSAALVTGAARRVGRAIAIRLARDGWAVAVHYNGSAADAESCVQEIETAGGRAMALQANLADEGQVATMVARASDALGPLGCLVNNASTFVLDTIETATRESWDQHLEPNLRAPFLLSQDFAKGLPADSGGCIVNVIDQRVWNLTPYFVSYTVSKAGLWTLTRSLAMALAPRIRVNAIGPGPTLPSPRQSDAQFARQEAHMPLGRGTTPEEIADTVVFLTKAHAMTGQMLALDGGQHLGWAQPGEDGLRFEE